MKSRQKARMCENCEKIFYGCHVFNGTQLIINVCSEKCFKENNEKFGGQ